jgi:phage terminase large subunit
LRENPKYYDQQLGDWTELGKDYIFNKLGTLTGVRRKRLLEGEWVAAEGQIYDTFDRGVHVVPNFTPPTHWRRIWAVDFGFVNPFVWKNYVIDPDGFMYVYQEFYHTKTLVSDACNAIWDAVQGQPYPDAIVCDHDAEDRATLERAFGIPTVAAYKDVARGIEAVKHRYELVFDGRRRDQMTGEDLGRPRLAYMTDTLIHPPDRELQIKAKPTCTVDEIEGYLWDTKKSEEKQMGDVPIKLDDHGVDVDRYAVAFEDNLAVELMDQYDGTVDLAEEYGYSNFIVSPY